MQKEKTSRKTLTQNVNIRTDASTDEKTKTIYPFLHTDNACKYGVFPFDDF